MDSTRPNRSPRLPSYLSCWLTSAVGIFCIGLMTGFGGGLLLGKTAALLLESLELLADNKLLMDNLKSSIKVDPFSQPGGKKGGDGQRTTNDNVNNIFVSLSIEMFAMISSTCSFDVGFFIGLLTYDLVIKKYGEAAKGKALALAGSVCLMGVTAIGYLLGFVLEYFLTYTCSISFAAGCFTAVMWIIIFVICLKDCSQDVIASFLIAPVNTPVVVLSTFIITSFFKSKLTLLISIFPIMLVVGYFIGISSFQQLLASHTLNLIITDVFNIAKQPIITLPSPNSTSIAVIEGLFIGDLTLHLMMAMAGMVLFVSWRTGGATKICFSAAALGGAVLTVVQSAQHILGPGPTVGALTGIAGAAGVCLAAAEAMTDQFGQTERSSPGRFGVAVGAAVGATLSSSRGLSKIFIGLYGATIPAGSHLVQLSLNVFESTGWKFKLCACVFVALLTIFSYFTVGHILFFIGLFLPLALSAFFHCLTI